MLKKKRPRKEIILPRHKGYLTRTMVYHRARDAGWKPKQGTRKTVATKKGEVKYDHLLAGQEDTAHMINDLFRE